MSIDRELSITIQIDEVKYHTHRFDIYYGLINDILQKIEYESVFEGESFFGGPLSEWTYSLTTFFEFLNQKKIINYDNGEVTSIGSLNQIKSVFPDYPESDYFKFQQQLMDITLLSVLPPGRTKLVYTLSN